MNPTDANDRAFLIDALRTAAQHYFEQALANRHENIDFCKDMLQRKVRALALAERLERSEVTV